MRDGYRPLTDGEKEQVKLSATYLNGVAVWLLLVGLVTVPMTLYKEINVFDLPTTENIIVGIVFTAISICAHGIARNSLLQFDAGIKINPKKPAVPVLDNSTGAPVS